MDDTTTDGVTESSATFAFSYKSTWDHAAGVASRPSALLGYASATFGALWSLYEATVNSLGLDANRAVAYLWILAISAAAAVGARIWSYMRECPEGLEGVSSSAQRIAHLQRTMWEFRFAKSVLAQLIAPVDRKWKSLRDDSLYVVAERPRDFRTYFQWLAGRPENLSRMLRVANRTMIIELPRALTSTSEKAADPRDILESLEAIAELYRESVEFEKASLSIIPPDEFHRAHELQTGWAEPIRDAVHQLFRFLQAVCDVDPNASTNLQFTITFKSIPNADDYFEELDRLESLLPEIIEREW